MSYNDLSMKAESTVCRLLLTAAGVSEALIATGGSEADQRIYAGTNSVEKSAPCIVVSAGSGQEEPYETGNYWLPILIEIKCPPQNKDEPLGDPRTNFKGLVSAVIDAMHDEDLVVSLNTAAQTASVDSGDVEFTVQGWKDRGTGGQPAEDVWTQTVEVMLYCCASSINMVAG